MGPASPHCSHLPHVCPRHQSWLCRDIAAQVRRPTRGPTTDTKPAYQAKWLGRSVAPVDPRLSGWALDGLTTAGGDGLVPVIGASAPKAALGFEDTHVRVNVMSIRMPGSLRIAPL